VELIYNLNSLLSLVQTAERSRKQKHAVNTKPWPVRKAEKNMAEILTFYYYYKYRFIILDIDIDIEN
jgi:hypothetical protein